LHAQLKADGEVLGEGFLTGAVLAFQDTHLDVEIPLSQAVIHYLDGAVADDQVHLTLGLSGFVRAKDDNTDGPQFASRPDPGEWTYEPFGRARQSELGFQIPRSDWFTRVLEPIGTTEFVATEIALPHGDHKLRAAAARLKEAERAYRTGDDPTVFARCRAATEALPGAPKEIFDVLTDREEAAALDQLLLKANTYFHRGRHVDSDGEFPVTHRDAGFALNLAKLLIAHAAAVLGRH
jgi:hypothetical protein